MRGWGEVGEDDGKGGGGKVGLHEFGEWGGGGGGGGGGGEGGVWWGVRGEDEAGDRDGDVG